MPLLPEFGKAQMTDELAGAVNCKNRIANRLDSYCFDARSFFLPGPNTLA
jgi:hypothetical protein